MFVSLFTSYHKHMGATVRTCSKHNTLFEHLATKSFSNKLLSGNNCLIGGTMTYTKYTIVNCNGNTCMYNLFEEPGCGTDRSRKIKREVAFGYHWREFTNICLCYPVYYHMLPRILLYNIVHYLKNELFWNEEWDILS